MMRFFEACTIVGFFQCQSFAILAVVAVILVTVSPCGNFVKVQGFCLSKFLAKAYMVGLRKDISGPECLEVVEQFVDRCQL